MSSFYDIETLSLKKRRKKVQVVEKNQIKSNDIKDSHASCKLQLISFMARFYYELLLLAFASWTEDRLLLWKTFLRVLLDFISIHNLIYEFEPKPFYCEKALHVTTYNSQSSFSMKYEFQCNKNVECSL